MGDSGRGEGRRRARGAGMVKLDKQLLAGSTAMVGGYAGVFLVAPILSYKLFFRGGMLPGVPVNEEVEEEPTKAHAQANRWCGLMMLQQLVVMPVIAAASFMATRD